MAGLGCGAMPPPTPPLVPLHGTQSAANSIGTLVGTLMYIEAWKVTDGLSSPQNALEEGKTMGMKAPLAVWPQVPQRLRIQLLFSLYDLAFS